MPLLGDGEKCSCSSGLFPTHFVPQRNSTWGNLSRIKCWIISDYFFDVCLDPTAGLTTSYQGRCILAASTIFLPCLCSEPLCTTAQDFHNLLNPLYFNHQWESAMGTSCAVVLLLALIFPLLVFPKCCLSFDVTYSMMVFQSSNLLNSAGTGCWSVFFRHFWQAVLT